MTAMIEIHKYVCSKCHKEFDTMGECADHEREHFTNDLNLVGLHLFTEDGVVCDPKYSAFAEDGMLFDDEVMRVIIENKDVALQLVQIYRELHSTNVELYEYAADSDLINYIKNCDWSYPHYFHYESDEWMDKTEQAKAIQAEYEGLMWAAGRG